MLQSLMQFLLQIGESVLFLLKCHQCGREEGDCNGGGRWKGSECVERREVDGKRGGVEK
jgi:hypothetical protein